MVKFDIDWTSVFHAFGSSLFLYAPVPPFLASKPIGSALCKQQHKNKSRKADKNDGSKLLGKPIRWSTTK